MSEKRVYIAWNRYARIRIEARIAQLLGGWLRGYFRRANLSLEVRDGEGRFVGDPVAVSRLPAWGVRASNPGETTCQVVIQGREGARNTYGLLYADPESLLAVQAHDRRPPETSAVSPEVAEGIRARWLASREHARRRLDAKSVAP